MPGSGAHIMQFFGVRTAGSSAFRFFPQWARALDVDGARLVGVDLPLGAGPAQYRAAVHRLKADPQVAGALVTSHKLAVVAAAGDLFDGFTETATYCGEVSALYKRDGRLWGHAADVTTCGQALDRFLGVGYWRRHPGAAVLLLGAGGAGVALVVYLLTQAPCRPGHLLLVDRKPEKLAHVRRLAEPAAGMAIDTVCTDDPAVNDRLMADLPPHSLVVNATGMGKDLPGSPVTDAGRFPWHGAVWELNYRGERRFLAQARRQAASRGLVVEDGWHYFILGWATVMSYVFDRPLTPGRLARFAAASAPLFPNPPAP